MPNSMNTPDPGELNWPILKRLTRPFEEAWGRNARPRIEDYLPAGDVSRRAVLVELVHIDCEMRLRRGDPATPAEYIDRFPELRDVPDLAKSFEEIAAEVAGQAPPAGAPRPSLGAALSNELQLAPTVDQESHRDTPDDELAVPQIDGFENWQRLGRGGMGVVYRAWQTALHRDVAVKVLSPELAAMPAAHERLVEEARAVARLEHPHIVRLYELREFEGQTCLVMEYVRDGSLARYLANCERPLDPRLAAAWTETLARAVHFAHQRQIVHHDLKPANVLLDCPRDGSASATPNGPSAQPQAQRDPWHAVLKVADFGLAKRSDSPDTPGRVAGTFEYMAPEQACGEGHGTVPADIYSLGAVLYTLLTLRPPIPRGPHSPGQSTVEIMHFQQRLQHEPPAPPSRLATAVPAELDAICLRCLEKEPNRRYAAASELADDLARYLRGEPVSARPIGPVQRFGKWMRRKPAQAAVLVLLFVAVVSLCGIAAGTLHLERVRVEQRLTEQARQDESIARQLAEASAAAATAARDAESRALSKLRIRSAMAAYENKELALMHRLLDQCPSEHRGWEWRYLTGLVRRGVSSVKLAAPITAIAYTPDGSRIAVAAGDWKKDPVNGTLTVLDARSGERRFEHSWTGTVPSCVAISPDGKLLATGTDHIMLTGVPGELALRDLATGRVIRQLTGHGGGIVDLCFASDTRLAAACRGPANPEKPQNVIAALGHPGEIVVWDLPSGDVVQRLRGHVASIASMAVAPDGKRIASVDVRRFVRIWEADTGKELANWGKLDVTVFSLAFSADGQRLFLACSTDTEPSGLLRSCELLTGNIVATAQAGDKGIKDVALSADGQRIVTAGLDTSVVEWNAQSLCRIRQLGIHQAEVHRVAYSPTADQIASGIIDGVLCLSDGQAGSDFIRVQLQVERVWDVAFSPNGRLVAAGAGVTGQPGTLAICDVATGKILQTRTHPGGYVRAVRFTPDGQRLVSGDAAGNIRIWQTETGEELQTIAAHTKSVAGIAIDPAGGKVVSCAPHFTRGDEPGELKVWDLNTGKLLRADNPHRGQVSAVAISPDGQWAASAGGGPRSELLIWRMDSGEVVRRIDKGDDLLHRIEFTPDGRRIVTSGFGAAPRVWAIDTGMAGPPFTGHEGITWSVAASADGARLVSAGQDHRVRLWDPSDGTETLTLRGENGAALSVAFSPKGTHIAAGFENGAVRIWDATP